MYLHQEFYSSFILLTDYLDIITSSLIILRDYNSTENTYRSFTYINESYKDRSIVTGFIDSSVNFLYF